MPSPEAVNFGGFCIRFGREYPFRVLSAWGIYDAVLFKTENIWYNNGMDYPRTAYAKESLGRGGFDMKCAYPIVMTQGEQKIVVYVPDFSIGTEGDTYADAMEMARDAIGLVGIDMEDDGETLPVPSNIGEIREDGIISLVDVDFAEYRRKHNLACVRKNCTIPAWLNDLAEKNKVNCSQLLQSALKEYPGVYHP